MRSRSIDICLASITAFEGLCTHVQVAIVLDRHRVIYRQSLRITRPSNLKTSTDRRDNADSHCMMDCAGTILMAWPWHNSTYLCNHTHPLALSKRSYAARRSPPLAREPPSPLLHPLPPPAPEPAPPRRTRMPRPPALLRRLPAAAARRRGLSTAPLRINAPRLIATIREVAHIRWTTPTHARCVPARAPHPRAR